MDVLLLRLIEAFEIPFGWRHVHLFECHAAS